MTTLTIKNLPEEIYAALTKLAKTHRRSINSEAIVQLEKLVLNQTDDVEEIIEQARILRAKYPKARVTDRDLKFAKSEGRP